MTTVNKEFLKSLEPCKERYENFLREYPYFSGSFNEFLSLNKITYDDKIWVSKLVLSRDILEEWAVLCAESVLHIFENKFKEDKRPRECIEYLKTKEKSIEKLKFHKNANAAAYAANATAAAANAAAYAANAAANAAAYAANAANAAPANAAAYAANAAANAAKKNQLDKNIDFLKSLTKDI